MRAKPAELDTCKRFEIIWDTAENPWIVLAVKKMSRFGFADKTPGEEAAHTDSRMSRGIASCPV